MLKNKHILITQPAIRSINGSTVVTLELTKELIKQGATVTIYTCDYANPAKTIFKKTKANIDTYQDNPSYKLSDFDFIWVHSQIIPPSIIRELSKKIANKAPSFIFLHMSGMDWIPDEKPWIYNLENQLSSLSLFICEEVQNVNRALINPKIPTSYFRNPAPTEYQNRSKKPKEQLEKLLIVSNHPPKEVLEAKKLLQEKHHIQVDILGEGQEKYELFSKNLLEQYDAILTIAKTVQYCLVSSTPVYVYDAYGGGPGWLNERNFEDAKKRNFSGYQNATYPDYEGGVFHKKTCNQIVTELINGYQDSLSFHQKHHNDFFPEFTITPVLSQIFSNLKTRKIQPLTTDYMESIIAAELFAADKFTIGGLLYERDQIIHSLTKERNQLAKTNKVLSQEKSKLTEDCQNLLDYQQRAEKVFNSKAYRLFDKAIQPYKTIKERTKHG